MADLRVQPEGESSEPKPGGGKGKTPLRKALTSLLVILAGLVVYAYGFQVVKVNLADIGSPGRRASLVRIVRALGHPDLVTYDIVNTNHDISFWIPCPEGGVTPQEPGSGPTVTVDPSCADPRATVTVTGTGFTPGATGRVAFIPPSGVELQPVQIKVGQDGTFTTPFLLPNRPDTSAPQTIRVVIPQQLGSWFHRVPVDTVDVEGNPVTVLSPRLSQTASDTWTRIIETVFLALLATTFGTALAVPLSFIAARNLMRDIAVPPLNLALLMLAGPVGLALGGVAAFLAQRSVGGVEGHPAIGLLVAAVLAGLVWVLLRRALFVEDVDTSPWRRAGRLLVISLAFVAGIAALYVLAGLGVAAGNALADALGPVGFLGRFLSTISQIVTIGLIVVAALAGAGALSALAGKLAYSARKRLPATSVRVLAIPLLAAAGALTGAIVSAGLEWMYDISPRLQWVIIPGIGALLGLALAARSYRRETVKIGLSVYYVARTVFNTLRAIEPLVMAIVFVVWVGIGPFAGSLALTLHTIAALSKLYSEQVESILPGPMEAIRATGATRMQTVVYGVIPQIVPPYISFTMYRWDINVRMSTVIGFVGGGGIGFLLQQNINLLHYRAAAAQMLAIAIVVASMDYLSSRIRERFV